MVARPLSAGQSHSTWKAYSGQSTMGHTSAFLHHQYQQEQVHTGKVPSPPSYPRCGRLEEGRKLWA